MLSCGNTLWFFSSFPEFLQLSRLPIRWMTTTSWKQSNSSCATTGRSLPTRLSVKHSNSTMKR